MDALRAAIKDIVPGSLLFLLVGQLIGVVLLFGPTSARRWGRRVLVTLLGMYFLLCLQGTSAILALGLNRGAAPLTHRTQANGARIIVVLSNGMYVHFVGNRHLALPKGQTSENALEAARLYGLLDNPIVIASGGMTAIEAPVAESEPLAIALERLGVPSSRIVRESASHTTYEQAVNVSTWLKGHDRPPFVLVTAPEHMRRAAAVFTSLGLPPAALSAQPKDDVYPAWRPSSSALADSQSAIYEYLAWCFYKWRGWL